MLLGMIPVVAKANQYRANAVNFDGTNDYLTRGAGLSGAADSKLLTASIWFKMAAGTDGGTHQLFSGSSAVGGGANRTRFRRQPTNVFQFTGLNAAAATIVDFASSATITVAAGSIHALLSFDLANAANRHLYVNDVSDYNHTTYTDDTMDLTIADWGVGAAADGTAKFSGDMANLAVWFGVYVDLSVVTNRRLFRDPGGKPVDPAIAIASLGTPTVLLSGATASWETNDGGGAGFTENGALSDATSSPSD
jgi:hypothetical protein